MKVPFHLHRSDERHPTTGLLLPSAGVAELLEMCARLQQDFPEMEECLPPVFRTAAGFLVKLPQATTVVHPGVLHLRHLADNLFLPCDAVLVPGLLDEEAAGLVRQRGLVFLPGGRALAFDPHRPLQPSELLTAPRLHRPPWRALPQRPPLAERLLEIRLELPDPPAEEVLAPGGVGIGEEEPRPGKAGLGATLAGEGLVQAGKGLAWLGGLLHWKGLAQWGASLARSGLRRAPRLLESVLGRQEAALRELLRQFREGNLEDALRRALPLGGGTERGGTTARNAALPTHRLLYSLRDLLGSGRGPVSWWYGGGEVQAELAREYRKAAQAAVERGDYRRAAFIYGRLLHDFREAAAVLARGGLHHDAALLYLEKVGDRRAAARELEAAGDLERALELYRQTGQHVEAGDLLRRTGEDEAALQEYLLAVQRLIPSDFAGAGDLLLEHAHRRDLALDYYRRGWAQRPSPNAFPCLTRLLRWHIDAAEPGPLLELVTQADAVFAQPGNDPQAAAFYNHLALHADRKELAPLRDELRDRALCGLAAKLRERSGGGGKDNAVSLLLGRSAAWQVAVVHDAEVAFKKGREERRPSVDTRSLEIGQGPVTALCSAWKTGDIFFGFAGGEVCVYQPRSDRRILVPPMCQGYTVTALSCNADGTILIVLFSSGPIGRLVSYGWYGGRYLVQKDGLNTPAYPPCWLTACAAAGQEVVGFWDGRELRVLATADLITLRQVEVPHSAQQAVSGVGSAATVLDMSDTEPPRPSGRIFGATLLSLEPSGKVLAAIVCSEDGLWWYEHSSAAGGRLFPNGRPSPWRSAPAPLLCHRVGEREHLVLLDRDGFIHEVLKRKEGFWDWPEHRTVAEGYVAAAWLAPGEVVGVRPEGIDWLRLSGNHLLTLVSLQEPLEDAIGCFAVPGFGEVIVVRRSGVIVRVRRPR
jgi:tetratricopeptide (TPR) repeat protein